MEELTQGWCSLNISDLYNHGKYSQGTQLCVHILSFKILSSDFAEYHPLLEKKKEKSLSHWVIDTVHTG